MCLHIHRFTNVPAFRCCDALLRLFQIHWKSPFLIVSLLHRSRRCPRDTTLWLPRLLAQITLSDNCFCTGCIKYLHGHTGKKTDMRLICGDKSPGQTVCWEKRRNIKITFHNDTRCLSTSNTTTDISLSYSKVLLKAKGMINGPVRPRDTALRLLHCLWTDVDNISDNASLKGWDTNPPNKPHQCTYETDIRSDLLTAATGANFLSVVIKLY